MNAVDPRLMQRAIELAEHGWGRVQPNPLVGALVVRDGKVIGEGWHAFYGAEHAEVRALAAAGEAARGATLYVTLEPCCHYGQTPPCTEAILQAGIRQVVVATSDPNPVAQGGAAHLRAAGVEVIEGVEASAARARNAAFFHWHERGTPYVALKLALSLDGAIGSTAGPRLLITGEAARAEANRLRAGYDAILVGANTALRDDPLLTVRGHAVRVPPVRVVLDSAARLAPGCRLLQTGADAPVIVFTAPDAAPERTLRLVQAGADVVPVPRAPGGLDIRAVLARLVDRGVRSVLVEGGAQLARALLGAEYVERLYLFLAPRILGAGTLKAFEPWPAARPSAWRTVTQARFGDDAQLVLDRIRSSG